MHVFSVCQVGGEFLEIALANMAPFGRVALCGSISQFNATESGKGIYVVSGTHILLPFRGTLTNMKVVRLLGSIV